MILEWGESFPKFFADSFNFESEAEFGSWIANLISLANDPTALDANEVIAAFTVSFNEKNVSLKYNWRTSKTPMASKDSHPLSTGTTKTSWWATQCPRSQTTSSVWPSASGEFTYQLYSIQMFSLAPKRSLTLTMSQLVLLRKKTSSRPLLVSGPRAWQRCTLMMLTSLSASNHSTSTASTIQLCGLRRKTMILHKVNCRTTYLLLSYTLVNLWLFKWETQLHDEIIFKLLSDRENKLANYNKALLIITMFK